MLSVVLTVASSLDVFKELENSFQILYNYIISIYVISSIHSSYYKILVKRMAVIISLAKPFFLFWLCCYFSFLSLSLSVPILPFPFSALATYLLSLWGLPFVCSRKCTDDFWRHLGTWGQTSLFLLQAPAGGWRLLGSPCLSQPTFS